ncbi:glycosyltransferase family 2 protein [Mesorhizobium sp. NPDC059054]|uniref:glycosyltransferase family 2 protein n=1 Tax=Mesorhizobium sp. NPDC059054 TaxID=3346711 RepID=UPI003685C331
MAQPTYSLIIPVYGNEENISSLLTALENISKNIDEPWEVIFVVDGSPDASGELLLQARSSLTLQTQVIFHSRNFGSFVAIRTGLQHARGRFFAVMAADLQEPPELMLTFFQILKSGEVDIVVGQRKERNDAPIRDACSRIFWGVFRRLVMRDFPRGGVDVFGCNEDARTALLRITEPNSSLVAQLFWIGFRRRFVPYSRMPRESGTSKWSAQARFRYMMDSILSFSDLPILLVLWLGLIGTLISTILGTIVALGRLLGAIEVEGYATIVLLICFFGSMTLVVNGILGCYIWRTFENTKQRPLGIVSRIYAN